MFEKDADFIVSNLLLPKEKQSVRGGHNKEFIKMNVSTFKAFCMTANTERGKTTRKYYSTSCFTRKNIQRIHLATSRYFNVN